MEEITRLKARLEEIDIKIGGIITQAQIRVDKLEKQGKRIEERIGKLLLKLKVCK